MFNTIKRVIVGGAHGLNSFVYEGPWDRSGKFDIARIFNTLSIFYISRSKYPKVPKYYPY